MAPVLPKVVVPIARRVLREMVGHLIVDATDAKLGPAIAKIKRDGVRLNVNLLGEAVLGEKEASRRLEGTERLLARPDVDYVSIKVSSTVHPHSPWAFDHAVEDIIAKLRPLFRRAVQSSPRKFINLDMEEYKDLDLTIAVFTKLLDEPEFTDLEAGIVLQAYLPDALAAMQQLQEWSAAPCTGRCRHQGAARQGREPADGTGRGVGARLAARHLAHEAGLGHELQARARLGTHAGARGERAGRGRRAQPVRRRTRLAARRGARGPRRIEFEMLLGMAQGQAEAVRRTVGSLLLYTPSCTRASSTWRSPT